jgi:PilZ domain-containing protein
MPLSHDRRQPRRQTRHDTAWISLKDDIRSFDCHVLDISEDGAKLATDINAPIGSTIYLSTIPHALVRKECEVVWQRKWTIGVKFA